MALVSSWPWKVTLMKKVERWKCRNFWTLLQSCFWRYSPSCFCIAVWRKDIKEMWTSNLSQKWFFISLWWIYHSNLFLFFSPLHLDFGHRDPSVVLLLARIFTHKVCIWRSYQHLVFDRLCLFFCFVFVLFLFVFLFLFFCFLFLFHKKKTG